MTRRIRPDLSMSPRRRVIRLTVDQLEDRTQPAPAENLGARATRRPTQQSVFTSAALRRPESNDGIWIQFRGEKWVSAGKAVPLRSTDFRQVGEYAGYPVFARTGTGTADANLIYLPTRGGLIAPYRVK